jgi:hypothetical protein
MTKLKPRSPRLQQRQQGRRESTTPIEGTMDPLPPADTGSPRYPFEPGDSGDGPWTDEDDPA